MRQPRRWRRTIAAVAVLLSVTAFAPGEAAAASCSGRSHNLALSSGTVSPGSGAATVTFRFTVTYADNAGCTPSRIVVVIAGGGTFAMTLVSGDLKTGASFQSDVVLPIGSHGYQFEATSGTGAGEKVVVLTSVSPAVVIVLPPPPPPTPTPIPTPKATPKPTPKPTPPPAPVVTQPPAAAPTAPVATAAPDALPGPVGTATTDPATPLESPGEPGASNPTTAQASGIPGGGLATGGSPPVDGPGGSITNSPSAPLGDGGMPRALLALIVATGGTLGGLALFALLGARLLGTSGGLSLLPVAGRRPRRHDPVPLPLPESPSAGVATFPDADALPDVDIFPDVDAIAAMINLNNPARNAAFRRAPVTFEKPPARGVQRSHVASRLVPLHATSGTLGGPLLGRLDVGDEVEVLRQDGTHCLVRTPSGVEGWLPLLAIIAARETRAEVPDDEI